MPADALPSAPSAPSATPSATGGLGGVVPPGASRAPGPVGALRLLAAFRREQADPDSFYGLLARDSVALVARHAQLHGSRVVDVGSGAGYFADAFRERGAQCLLVEPDSAELCIRGAPSCPSVIGDGYWLPLGDASVDVCFSCNVLEHVRDPAGLIDEMIRATRPGGLVYLSYTVWLSPCGETMFPLSVGQVLSLVRRRGDVAVVEARPRYYPGWCRFLISLPGVRELLTWNLLLILRRRA
jgi:SAM-dependent methyltransferase